MDVEYLPPAACMLADRATHQRSACIAMILRVFCLTECHGCLTPFITIFYIFYRRADRRSGTGLVQQTVQIVASHDLTLFVRRHFEPQVQMCQPLVLLLLVRLEVKNEELQPQPLCSGSLIVRLAQMKHVELHDLVKLANKERAL